MKTNNEIVEIIKKTYKIKQLIEKVINNSYLSGSSDDMEQYIYEHLLNMNNTKLNKLFNTGRYIKITHGKNELRKYICALIKNNRNYYRSYYNLFLRLNDNYEQYFEETYEILTEEEQQLMEDEKDGQSAKLLNFFKNNTYTGKTNKDKENFTAIYFLSLKTGIEIQNNKIILVKPMSIINIAKEFVDEHINKTKLKTKTYLVSKYINIAKELLKEDLQKK